MRVRTYLPEILIDKGVKFKQSSVIFDEKFPEEIKRLKSENKKFRLVKVLAKNLRGKVDIHNKPYEPLTYLFEEMQQYDILSPDGFSIHPINTYNSPEDAIKAFHEWKKGYEKQGYYSTNKGERIPLADLESYCTLKEL